MIDRIINAPYIRAVWGNRDATERQVADGVHAMLARLEPLDPILSDWMLDRTTRLPDAAGLAARLEHRPPGDRPDEPWEVLVVSNGVYDDGLSVTVGEGNRIEHPLYLNEVMIKPAPTFDGARFFARHGRQMLETVVEVWHPDYAAFLDSSLAKVQTRGRRTPMVGGLTWFADHLGAVPPVLPEGARIYRLGDGTAVDLLEPDGALPSPDRVAEVADWLDRAGLREPIPQVQPQAAAPR